MLTAALAEEQVRYRKSGELFLRNRIITFESNYVCFMAKPTLASLLFKGLACVSQKTRQLLGPEDFSGLFSGEFLGSRG